MLHNNTVLYKKLEIITNILNPPIIPNKKIKVIGFQNKSDFQAPKMDIITYANFRSLVQKLN